MKQKGSCLISLSPSTPITSLSCFACCQFRKNHAETLNGANRMRELLGREKSKKCCSCWCLVLELYRDIMTYQVWSVLDGKHCRNCSDAGVSSVSTRWDRAVQCRSKGFLLWKSEGGTHSLQTTCWHCSISQCFLNWWRVAEISNQS